MLQDTFISDQFNTWIKCRKRYYFKYLKKLNWPDLETDYTLGKSVHALINYHLKGFKVDHLLNNADDEVKKRWEIIKGHPILQNKMIATEWPFYSRIKDTNYWLNGRMDAVLYDESEQKYIIADWKTGESSKKNYADSFQHLIYLYSLYNCHKDLNLNMNKENLIFQYVKITDDIEIITYPYSEQTDLNYELQLKKTILEIENSKDYPANNPCPIKQCQYKHLC